MFQRFGDDARAAVVAAQEEARALRHDYVGTEHLLLGVLAVDGVGHQALERLGIHLDGVREDVARIIGRGWSWSDDAEALREIGIDLERVHERVDETFGPGSLESRPLRRPWFGWRRCGSPKRIGGHRPVTPRLKKVLELALREAEHLGHGRIGTEHLLLGVVREGAGVAAEILSARGATPRRVRAVVLSELSDPGDQPGRSA